jgi:Holliday junction resolvase RusA-like endonuclease
MGIPSRQFSREQLARGGVERLASSHVRPQTAPSLQGYFWGWLAGEPPTVTHHDKDLGWRWGSNGQRTPTLRNSAKLNAARDWYLARVPERNDLIPLRPPVLLKAVFCWALSPDTTRWPSGARYGGYRFEKPDLDNCMKVLKDVLAERGFLYDDSHVCLDGGSQKRWCHPNQCAGIAIYARSLSGPLDEGPTFQPDVGDRPWLVYPAPWSGEVDTRTQGVASIIPTDQRSLLYPAEGPVEAAVRAEREGSIAPDELSAPEQANGEAIPEPPVAPPRRSKRPPTSSPLASPTRQKGLKPKRRRRQGA